ncbi:hypothetical protein, partial [Limnobacter sp.]|uniref:hypothetical protein n=1 Tax=Limnobacter sp. TaxID=2003368 RepID=UPI002737781D
MANKKIEIALGSGQSDSVHNPVGHIPPCPQNWHEGGVELGIIFLNVLCKYGSGLVGRFEAGWRKSTRIVAGTVSLGHLGLPSG